jgi:hypothetical protein
MWPLIILIKFLNINTLVWHTLNVLYYNRKKLNKLCENERFQSKKFSEEMLERKDYKKGLRFRKGKRKVGRNWR